MKQILFLLISLFPCISIAQSRASVDLIAGVDYSHRALRADNIIADQAIKKTRDSTEIPGIGFRGGLNVNLRLGRKLFFKTGLRFVSAGYNSIKLTGLVHESEYDPISGAYVRDPSLPHELQLKATIRFVELPIGLRYVFYSKKFSYFTEIGFTSTYLINHQLKTITDIETKSEVNKNTNILDLHFNGIISLGIQKEINDEMQVFIQPVFRFALSTLSNSPIKEYLYSAGAECGLRYYIGRK